MAILGSWGFVLVYLLAAIKKELAEKLLVNRQVERLRSSSVLDIKAGLRCMRLIQQTSEYDISDISCSYLATNCFEMNDS
jgi:hypothetical protein